MLILRYFKQKMLTKAPDCYQHSSFMLIFITEAYSAILFNTSFNLLV